MLCANEEQIFDVADRARKLGSRVLALLVDVSDKAQVASLFKQIQDEFSALDVSVHNAGIIKIARLAELSEQDWDEVMDVNCKGVFLCCQHAAEINDPSTDVGALLMLPQVRLARHALSLLTMQQVKQAW